LKPQSNTLNQLTPSDTKSPDSIPFLSWWPVGLTALLLALRVLLPAAIIEAVYSRGLFVALRYIYDFTIAWLLPFPIYYLFWVGVIWWVWATVRGCRERSKGRRGEKEKGSKDAKAWPWLFRRVVNSIALLVATFLLAWGFNYGRVPVDRKIGFTRYQPTLKELRARVYTEAAQLARLRTGLTADTFALTAADLGDPLDVRPLLRRALRADGYPDPGRPGGQQLYPKGILLSWSTAGVYWPWAGEGNIDAGLHPLQKPAVMAHELAHAYGFGDEGTCTFWAWRTAAYAEDPRLAYPLRLAYWRRIAGKLRQLEPEAYWAWRAASLDPGIRNDLQAIYDNGKLYKNIAPAVRNATYDAYLKAQGVHEGLMNYGTVVQLVEGYRVGRQGKNGKGVIGL